MEERYRFLKSMLFPALFVVVLWALKGAEEFAFLDLGGWGNHPRSASGMLGIVTSPFVHGDLGHLTSNSFPILLLGSLIIYFYPVAALRVILGIYLLTGIAVWLFARPVYHIGASGLVYGFAFFLFFSGVFRNDMKSLAISFLIIFLYGGIVWGLMPNLIGISWESHLFGAITGSLFAYLFRNFDLQPKELWSFDDETQPAINYRYTYVPKDNPAEIHTQPENKPDADEKEPEQNTDD